MIRWGRFLERLREDSVTLNTVEHEGITEDDERITTRFLSRVVDGRYLYCEVDFESLDDPVPRRKQRQIANLLRLPPEKHHFRER